MTGFPQVAADLRYIFSRASLESLLHLRDNRHRLTRWNYSTHDGRGCIMYLLTERMPADQRITSKDSLMRFFCDGWRPGKDCSHDPEYQAAKWIVRLWDGHICEQLRHRYGAYTFLSEEDLFNLLDEVIAERQAIEREAKANEERALERLNALPVG